MWKSRCILAHIYKNIFRKCVKVHIWAQIKFETRFPEIRRLDVHLEIHKYSKCKMISFILIYSYTLSPSIYIVFASFLSKNMTLKYWSLLFCNIDHFSKADFGEIRAYRHIYWAKILTQCGQFMHFHWNIIPFSGLL